MTKRASLAFLLAAGAGCGTSYADQPAMPPQPPGPRIAIAIAGDKIRAPYDVQLIRENGETLPTYALKDRFYVQGNANERYTIRVTNPTDRRVEAVVSVDGLDVVDGEDGDLHKRGYIVPPHGDVRLEGFRTSLENVATFRFSSVDGSYAGKKGKARNVGVVAVAIFEEVAPPPDQQIVSPEATNVPRPSPKDGRRYDYTDDLDASATGTAAHGQGRDYAKADRKAEPKRATTAATKSADKRVAEQSRPAAPNVAPVGGYGGAGAPARPSPAPPPSKKRYSNYDDEGGEYEAPREESRTGRLGLGTEYGEQRSSGATYTRFVRAADRPIAVAELRYNDVAGLLALGIHAQPLPDSGEIMMRETADPFPGDRNFSRAP
jgi:hypothetical protein